MGKESLSMVFSKDRRGFYMKKLIVFMMLSVISPLFAADAPAPVEMGGYSLAGLADKLSTLERFIYKRFGGDPAYQEAGAHPPQDPSHTMLLEKFQTLHSRLTDLANTIEELQHQIMTLKLSAEKMQDNIDGKVSHLERKLSETHETVKKAEEQAYQDKINKMSANELLLHIETSGRMLPEDRFEKALRLFSTKFSADNRVSSVYKELVYLTYKKENYEETAFYAGEFFRKSPKSMEAPEILLMMSFALGRLNKEKESCLTLDKIRKDYPEIAASEDFKERLDMASSSMSCSV